MFSKHLQDAISINKTRQAIYAHMTEGRSKRLSSYLIASEYLSLPWAYYFDSRAKRFNVCGIPVVQNDFVSMTAIKPADAAPQYRNLASASFFQDLKQKIRCYQQQSMSCLKHDDLEAVCACSREMLVFLQQMEEESKANFAMTRHLIESLAFAAQNALVYAAQSSGETLKLSKHLVNLQRRVVAKGLVFDKLAQPLHALGCGIIVNDVPSIPFV